MKITVDAMGGDYALRQKRNASILMATKLVKEGKADTVIGAGPTGGVI